MLLAVAAAQALEFIGMPEARLPMTQAIIAVCESEKSNSVVMAIAAAMEDAKQGQIGAVPEHLRDTHYAGHERVNDTAGYLYPHDFPGHWVRQNYMPEGFERRVYYQPGQLGFEAGIRKKKEQNGSKP